MIDRPLMLVFLTVLQAQKALACGAEENDLFNELNLRATCTVTTGLLREHLSYAHDKGWIDYKLDSIRMKRWRITPAGENELDDLKHGG